MKSNELKPINPSENTLCYEEDTEKLYQFKNGHWVLMGYGKIFAREFIEKLNHKY